MDDQPQPNFNRPSALTAAGSAVELWEAAFLRRSRMELMLYAAIERTADQLPGFDPDRCGALLGALETLSLALNSRSLIALLLELRPESQLPNWRRHAQRLLYEEQADAATVVELKDALECALEVDFAEEIGALSYLMRGVVDSRRRHLIWAAEILTVDDLTMPIDRDALRRMLRAYSEVTDTLRILYPTN